MISKETRSKDDCNSYHQSGRIKRSFRANVLSNTDIPDVNTVTLVTHLTSDRYDRLINIKSTWNGPISATVYVKRREDIHHLANTFCFFYVYDNWNFFYLHLVDERGIFYPVNYLRNTAITQAPTDFLFITDVDFVTMPHTYEILHTYVGSGIPKKNEVAAE
ncbi:hypothetical protein LSH36_314g00000 [Paralvinella palmiformis]|uniref:Uncharacterized protein n=1 Tax=Paralvinella palmiformis TaxID=53620 RepID=A0AAD9JHU8_9ANNE|nr:hypothetical protein LSH36_314g00000 [Paralvinella palmiformis]